MTCQDCVRHPAVQLCIRVTRWLPVLFIVVIVCWSYYAYVVELCLFTIESIPEKVLYLIPYHIILFLFLWSYWQTTFAQIREPPKQYLIPEEFVQQIKQSTPNTQREILERLAKDLPVITRSFDGAIRYCEKCNLIKPDRSHHCAVCGICVLKMDHHCPWVNTCVHYNNYKFFILFLGYALLFCLFVFLTDLQYFIKFWTNDYAKQGGGKFHIMFLFFVSGMFGISVSSLFFYHLWLTSKNRSTLEAFRPPVFSSGADKNGFNLGCCKNFRQVFGAFNPLAFFPVFTSPGDGCSYPTRPSLITSFYPNEGPAPNPANAANPAAKAVGDGYELNGVISSPGLKPTETGNFQNAGDGIRYPSRVFSLDEEHLLNGGNRWTDDTEESGSDYENNRPKGFRRESQFGAV